MSSVDVPERRLGKWRFVAIVAAVILALLGFIAYVGYQNSNCGFDCGPVDVPVILNAYVNQSGVKTYCTVANQGVPQAAVCDVTTSGEASGTIVLNMTSQYGSSIVQFGNYSSESPHIRFTSTPPCTYPSGPVINAGGCRVYENGTIFRFGYTVAQDFLPGGYVSFTITVTKTCCWP
jgi:hypothetical protein